jgi:hypothetical protein
VLVTPSLIAARGRGQGGAAYTWYDGSTEPGQRYSYWLAEIELNGRVNEYGPADSAGTAAQQVLYVPVVVR